MLRSRLSPTIFFRWCLLIVALGATTGCPTVDLGEEPASPGLCRPDPSFFADAIWPEMIASEAAERSCVSQGGCHSLENGRSALRFTTANPIDFDTNYDVAVRFLNCGTPSSSSLLTKPIAEVDSHGGGDIFSAGSDQEMVFLQWFDM